MISEANSEGAAMRVSPSFDTANTEQRQLAQSVGQNPETAFIFDWISDLLKGKATDSPQCEPSPLYDHAVSLAQDLYFDRSLAAKLAEFKNKFNCQIKTDEDAVKFANEALHVMGDPYTRVLDKKQADELKNSITGDKTITGIGINIGLQKNDKTGGASYPIVGAVFPGTPAERAGLKPGDIIMQVGDQSTKDLSVEKVQTMVRGEDGSRVLLKIDRDGKMMDINATRARMEVPATLEYNFGDVHYVRLIDFMNDKTDVQLRNAILTNPYVKSFIVDLRGNPGGRVDEMIETIGLLMKEGKIYTEQTRTRSGEMDRTIELTPDSVRQKIKGSIFSPTAERNRYLLNGRPLVVLVDEFSASASELLAGAIKDNGLGIVVGAKTFGKGVGQQIISIENGTMVAVTNTKFTNPGGNWSGDGNERRIGIEPNISVASEKGIIPLSLNDKQFQRALEEARRLAGSGTPVNPGAQPGRVEQPVTVQPGNIPPFVNPFAIPGSTPSVPFLQRLKEMEELRKRMQQQNEPAKPADDGSNNAPAPVKKPYGTF